MPDVTYPYKEYFKVLYSCGESFLWSCNASLFLFNSLFVGTAFFMSVLLLLLQNKISKPDTKPTLDIKLSLQACIQPHNFYFLREVRIVYSQNCVQTGVHNDIFKTFY